MLLVTDVTIARSVELRAVGMLETEPRTDVSVGQDAIDVTRMDLVLLLDVGSFGVAARIAVTDAPQIAGRRNEHGLIIHLAAAAPEISVALDADGVKTGNGDGGEDGDVGGRDERIGAVDAIKPCGQHPDSEVVGFGIIRPPAKVRSIFFSKVRSTADLPK